VPFGQFVLAALAGDALFGSGSDCGEAGIICAGPDVLEILHQRLVALPKPRRSRALGRADFIGSLGVFLLVVLSTFPVVLPFALVSTTALALHISQLVALVMLFLGGWALGRYGGGSPGWGGFAMIALGMALVAAITALGG